MIPGQGRSCPVLQATPLMLFHSVQNDSIEDFVVALTFWNYAILIEQVAAVLGNSMWYDNSDCFVLDRGIIQI